MAAGARCDVCPIGPKGRLRISSGEPLVPVLPEINDGAEYLLVGESPAWKEVQRGYPLAGASGLELARVLAAAGLTRSMFSLTNVLLCKIPGDPTGAWSRMTATLSRMRKARSNELRASGAYMTKAAADRAVMMELPDPVECCHPALLATAEPYRGIVPLGASALRAVTGVRGGIAKHRGDTMKAAGLLPEGASSEPKPALASFHPAFTMRSPAARPWLKHDLEKALRYFNNKLRWTYGDRLRRPTVEQFRDWLLASCPGHAEGTPYPEYSFDIETTGIVTFVTDVRCFAIAAPDLDEGGIVVDNPLDAAWPARSVGVTREWYSARDWWRILRLFDDWLHSVGVFAGRPLPRVVGHNVRSFDYLVMKHRYGITLIDACTEDSLDLARAAMPDSPKGLKPQGRLRTDVDRWDINDKGEEAATSDKVSAEERQEYNETDCIVNLRILPSLRREARENGYYDVVDYRYRPSVGYGSAASHPELTQQGIDHSRRTFCRDMSEIGIVVDQVERRRQIAQLRIEAADHLYQMKRLATEAGAERIQLQDSEGGFALGTFGEDDVCEMFGLNPRDVDSDEWAAAVDELKRTSDFNPASFDQMRRLLYEDWQLGVPKGMSEKEFLTGTGLPGTGDAVILAHMAGSSLSRAQLFYLQHLRLYRRKMGKMLGTTLLPLGLRSEGGLVWDHDGRVRSTFGSHSTAVWRLTSNGPSLMVIGKKKGQAALKTIFVPGKGPKGEPHVFIGPDIDQLHLRIIANRWGIPVLCEAFANGVDPHGALAAAVYGDAYFDATGWGDAPPSLKRKPEGGDADMMRDVMKIFRYAAIYGAAPATIWRVITSTERNDGSLPYLGYQLDDIIEYHEKWMRAEPQWQWRWDALCAEYRRNGGWMKSGYTKVRSGPLEDGKLNAVVNWPVLRDEAHIAWCAEQQLLTEFYRGHAGPGTGVVLQVHDQLVVETRGRAWHEAGPGGKKILRWDADAERARARVEELMQVVFEGEPVAYTSSAGVGTNLKEA